MSRTKTPKKIPYISNAKTSSHRSKLHIKSDIRIGNCPKLTAQIAIQKYGDCDEEYFDELGGVDKQTHRLAISETVTSLRCCEGEEIPRTPK